MRVTIDTNVLLRATLDDDPVQNDIAASILREAEAIAVPSAVLCEFVWVMRGGYKKTNERTVAAIKALLADPKVVCDRAAAEAGLAMLIAGGDFADGIIAFEGRRLGGDIFATFDKKAARLIAETGGRVELL